MKHDLFTHRALQGSRIAAAFRGEFATTKVGDLVPEISEPEESTRGGALALQHVALKSPHGHSLVVGTVNALERRAELRSFAFVAGMHEARFQKPPPFDAAAYADFIARIERLFGDQGIKTGVTGDAPMTAPSSNAETYAPGSTPERGVARWLVAFMIGVAVAVAFMWLVRR